MKIDIRLLEKRMRLHEEVVSGIYAKEFWEGLDGKMLGGFPEYQKTYLA